jgi:hypothetical protein
MKMFSDCSGSCEDCVIGYHGMCVAGHGDDNFLPISEKTAKKLIEKRVLKDYQEEQLRKKFPSLNAIKI